MDRLDIKKLPLSTNACRDLAAFMGINLSNVQSCITNEMIAEFNELFIKRNFDECQDPSKYVAKKLWRFNMLFSKANFELCLKRVNLEKASRFSLEAQWEETRIKELWRHDKYQGQNYYLEPDGEKENERTIFNTTQGVITLHLRNSQ